MAGSVRGWHRDEAMNQRCNDCERLLKQCICPFPREKRQMTIKQFLITVKLPMAKVRPHDPNHKVTGPCPVNPDKTCTDVTGAHHTFMWGGANLTTAEHYWSEVEGYHVTRIEEV